MSIEKEIRIVGAKQAEADVRGVQNALDDFNKTVSKNRDATRLLDRATGGAVTQFQDLQKGIVQGVTGVKGLSASFKGLKASIAATGIGLIVVALGTIYAYWDDIKEAINGVSSETKTLLGQQEQQVQETTNVYDNILATSNILKQQGKTEREILNLKIKATDETITALEAQLTTQKEIKKAQVETAKRNSKILSGILLMITAPIAVVLTAIDEFQRVLGKERGTLAKDFYEGIGNFVFDPEGLAEAADESIAETEKQLTNLKNRKAGFENNITQIEKTEADKRFAEKQKQYKKEFDAYKKHLEEMTQLTIDDIERLGQIRKSYNDKIEEQAVIDEETKIELDREKALKEIEELEINEGLKGNARLAVNTFYDNQLLELAKNTSDQEKAQRLADFTATKEIESAKFGLLGQFGGLLSEIAGENKTLAIAGVVAQQAAAVGQIVSQTAIANAKSVAALPLTLGQPWVGINTVSAGLSIASTVASAAKSISKIKSSDSSASTMTANVPQAASGGAAAPPSFNIVGQSSTDQLTEAISGQTQQPVKAYVVSNDVTTAQSLDRNIVQGATIG